MLSKLTFYEFDSGGHVIRVAVNIRVNDESIFYGTVHGCEFSTENASTKETRCFTALRRPLLAGLTNSKGAHSRSSRTNELARERDGCDCEQWEWVPTFTRAATGLRCCNELSLVKECVRSCVYERERERERVNKNNKCKTISFPQTFSFSCNSF